jgi:hypothetical protein
VKSIHVCLLPNKWSHVYFRNTRSEIWEYLLSNKSLTTFSYFFAEYFSGTTVKVRGNTSLTYLITLLLPHLHDPNVNSNHVMFVRINKISVLKFGMIITYDLYIIHMIVFVVQKICQTATYTKHSFILPIFSCNYCMFVWSQMPLSTSTIRRSIVAVLFASPNGMSRNIIHVWTNCFLISYSTFME